jgi:two-component system, chemotaxis family, sensor kinase CheA
MLISNEYSRECVHIFRGPIGGKNFLELMHRHLPEDSRGMVEQIFGNVFSADKNLQRKVYLSLLPGELQIYNRSVRAEYKVTQHLDQKRMMLVLTDITEKKELEQKMALERSNLRLVVKALAKQSDVNLTMQAFTDFVCQDAPVIIENAETPRAALAEVFRMVHTFKGDFGQYGLHNTAAQLHAIEDALAVLVGNETPPTREELLALVRRWNPEVILNEDKYIILESLGKSYFETEERFLISKERLLDIENRVQKALQPRECSEVLPLLRSLRQHDVKELLQSYAEYLRDLAARLEKTVEPLAVTGDAVRVDKDVYNPFFKSLVHVFRNMIDHGMETPEQRLEAGKRELGVIKCKVKWEGSTGFRITIADDGAGVDIDRVRRKAVEKGLCSEEQAAALRDEQCTQLLFLDSLSTKDEITTLSGRGVGLSAVKAELESLGGTVFVTTKPGQGTKFTFQLPVLEG